jgi:hypothetical protein
MRHPGRHVTQFVHLLGRFINVLGADKDTDTAVFNALTCILKNGNSRHNIKSKNKMIDQKTAATMPQPK